METSAKRYAHLFECESLKKGEEVEIFAAIEAGLDVDFNKERLFNALFKKIYKEACAAIKNGFHDDLDEVINHIAYYFYQGIDTYKPDKGACFYTHISHWIRCAVLNIPRIKAGKNLIYVSGEETSEDEGSALNIYNNFDSGINVFDEVCKSDFLNKIDEFLENSNFRGCEKQAFTEYYGLNGGAEGKTARVIGREQGVSAQSVLNRKNAVEKSLKYFFKDSYVF